MTPSPILAQLRTDTRAAHDALEALPFNQAIQAGTPSEPLVVSFLQKMYGFLLPYEARLRQHPFGPEWQIELRQRAHLITADLPTAGLPVCPQMPPLETLPQLLGAMYVLEGSTLGGQVIARQLDQHGINLQAYFRGNGEHTGPLWKSFCQLLPEAVPEADHPAVVDSARLTFQHLHAWLTQP